ncbi:DUF87 domain-containing protein [Mycoplasmopsis felis]|uniref:Mbov_0397 family ICE element conjugal transfer ATPase n=3 Tax=Mycoplasmopsis felis TaxID=33923 RepID=UPI002AFFDC75|nr:DUF87 domain-containing protein [Mycoplasmopsis felis]WQQ09508.1 DUF87 domain-containing protein [Mycoplasmopsis felis]WQQ09684.1 DUF87 domain-containing protein [Mycoplasmopsis felis]
MLQPKRLKNRWTKLTRWFNVRDAIEIIVICALTYTLSWVIFKDFEIAWAQYVCWIILMLFGFIFIIPYKESVGKVYNQIWRIFLYWLSPKKYKNNNDNKSRDTDELNPFSRLYGPDIVINKRVLGDSLINKKDVQFNCFCVFKIHGFNLANEDQLTQDVMLERYTKALGSLSNKFSFIKIDENVNFEDNINFLEKNYKKESEWETYFEYNKNDLEIVNNDVKVSNYYLIINAPNPDQLNYEATLAYNLFLESKILLKKLEEIELLNFLNKYRNFNISEDKLSKWYEENKELMLNQEKIDEDILDDIFVYDEVIFHKNYFTINGKFYSIKAIDKIPYELENTWSKLIFNLNGTILENNFPYKNRKDIDKILNKASIHSEDRIQNEVQATEIVKAGIDANAVNEFVYQISKGGYSLLDVNFLVIVQANSLKELREIERENDILLNKGNMKLSSLSYFQFQGFVDSSLSINYKLHKEAYQMSSYILGYGYPFLYEIFNDKKNLILGFAKGSNAPVSLDIFDLGNSNRTNHNMFVLGSSGIGKSTVVSKILASNLAINNKVIIIDPQNEYSDFCKKFNGQIIDLGSGINTRINIIQIRNNLRDFEDQLSISQLVNAHISLLEKFFKTLYADINWDILESLLKEFYRSIGIYELNSIKEIKNEEWKTISDFIEFMKNYKYENIFNIEERKKYVNSLIDKFSNSFENYGRYQDLFNGYTTIELKNDFIVFKMNNLTNTNDDVAGRLGLMFVLSFCNEIIYQNFLENEVRRNKYKEDNKLNYLSANEIDMLTKRIILCIDEEHIYIKEKNILALDYIVETTKTIRKFDGSTIHTTQNPSDYKSSMSVAENASRILQNCNYSILLGLKSSDIDAVKSLFANSQNALTDAEIHLLSQQKKGQCLLGITDNIRYKIDLHYNDYEKQLFFKKG